MSINLPPSSAFAPDPAVARARSMSPSHTLTLPLARGPTHGAHEPMSGGISIGLVGSLGGETLRAATVPADEMALTITF